MIFDSHAHLVSDDFERYPPTPLGGTLDRKLDDPVTAEKLLALMDANGVDRAVAVQRAHVYGYNNDYVIDSAERYPDRLVAVCVIDADAVDGPAVVRRWAERGAVGMRLSEKTRGAGTDWLASDRALATWAEVSRLRLSMCVHMYRWNRDEVLLALAALAAKFPSVPLVIDHLSNVIEESGAPDWGVDAALNALAAHAQVRLKFSQINLARMAKNAVPAASVIERVVRAFGAERVMWGSDVAQSAGTYEEMVRMAQAAVANLSKSEQQLLLHGCAKAVYSKQ